MKKKQEKNTKTNDTTFFSSISFAAGVCCSPARRLNKIPGWTLAQLLAIVLCPQWLAVVESSWGTIWPLPFGLNVPVRICCFCLCSLWVLYAGKVWGCFSYLFGCFICRAHHIFLLLIQLLNEMLYCLYLNSVSVCRILLLTPFLQAPSGSTSLSSAVILEIFLTKVSKLGSAPLGGLWPWCWRIKVVGQWQLSFFLILFSPCGFLTCNTC